MADAAVTQDWGPGMSSEPSQCCTAASAERPAPRAAADGVPCCASDAVLPAAADLAERASPWQAEKLRNFFF